MICCDLIRTDVSDQPAASIFTFNLGAYGCEDLSNSTYCVSNNGSFGPTTLFDPGVRDFESSCV